MRQLEEIESMIKSRLNVGMQTAGCSVGSAQNVYYMNNDSDNYYFTPWQRYFVPKSGRNFGQNDWVQSGV